MRYSRSYAVALAVLAAGCDASTADIIAPTSVRAERSVSVAVHSLTGSGKLDLSEFDLKAETYTFAVFQYADGSVNGQIEIHLRDPAVSFHADATCLSVQDNNAWVGGVVTHTSDPNSAPVGLQFWVRVQDNGESSDNPDRISFVRLGIPAANCNFQRAAALSFGFAGGNLRVR
jgi:hypothetical protein